MTLMENVKYKGLVIDSPIKKKHEYCIYGTIVNKITWSVPHLIHCTALLTGYTNIQNNKGL